MNDMRKLMETTSSLFEESEYQELLGMLRLAEKKLEDCYYEAEKLGEEDFARRIGHAENVIIQVIQDVEDGKDQKQQRLFQIDGNEEI